MDNTLFWFIAGLVGIPFILVYLIALIATGENRVALQSAFIFILVAILIGFVVVFL